MQQSFLPLFQNLNSLLPVEGLPKSGRAEQLALPAESKNNDDHDIRQHDGELIGEVDSLSLNGQLEGLRQTEQQGPSHNLHRMPVTEVNQCYSDEPTAGDDLITEHFCLAEAQVGSGKTSQGTTDSQSLVAHPVDLDAD